MYSIWCLPYRPSELISQRRGRRHLRSYSVHKHNTQEKQERRASARPGDRSVLPPRRSLLVLSIASPSKSGTIPRSTSSQLTCLSLSAARCGSFPTLFFFPACSHHRKIFPATSTPWESCLTAIWSVRCVAHKNYS